MKLASALALFSLFLSAGCGYHISGKADMMPKTVKTIAVEPFSNVTKSYKLARLLPTDIAHELISRTKYAIVADPNQADAVLKGALVNFQAYPIVLDNVSSRATVGQVVATVQLTLTERSTGKVLYSRPSLEFRDRYEISVDPQQYFDETGTAIERVARDVARTVVSSILENF
jgi:RNase P/RNase MRP subunit p29